MPSNYRFGGCSPIEYRMRRMLPWHICDCYIPGMPAQGCPDRRFRRERGVGYARSSEAESQTGPDTDNTHSTHLPAAEPSPLWCD